jgi:hypothetical protein
MIPLKKMMRGESEIDCQVRREKEKVKSSWKEARRNHLKIRSRTTTSSRPAWHDCKG